MGRYAQRRRRGGSPPIPASAATIAIDFVERLDVGLATIHFDGEVAVNPGDTDDANFTVAGIHGINAVNDSPTQVTVQMDGDFAADAAWSLVGQPTWLFTPIAFPASGNLIPP